MPFGKNIVKWVQTVKKTCIVYYKNAEMSPKVSEIDPNPKYILIK